MFSALLSSNVLLVADKSSRKRALIEVFRPLYRRSDLGATNADVSETQSEDETPFGFQKGIVDECCKKQCAFATLVSYCANVQQGGNVDLEGVPRIESETSPAFPIEDLAAYHLQQVETFIIMSFHVYITLIVIFVTTYVRYVVTNITISVM